MTKRVLALAAVAATAATSASAAGLDRSFQSISPIFNDSGTLSFSHSRVMPSVTGSDSTGASYDVGESYSNTTLAYTHGVSDKFTLGFIVDQPFGADTFYNGDPTATNLAGTAAELSSEAFTLLGKYQLNERVSLIGGIKGQRVKADVKLNGLSYARAISTSAVARIAGVDSTTLGAALLGDPTAIAALGGLATVTALGSQVTAQVGQFQADGGYSFQMDAETEYGWVVGAAYEIPDIALRLAVTYHSEIDYSANTTETLLGNVGVPGTVNYVTPESLNIEFQTGIAADTLLLASYRWSAFEDVDVVPFALGSDLVNLDNAQRFTLGVGRRFSDEWSGTAILSYEPKGDDDLVSPLGPTNGLFGISIGGRYVKDNLEVVGGINYSWLGDAEAEVGGQSQASFTGNSSVAVGFNVKFTF
ncbi:MAG: outer membrane protein transport protein [Pseudomonadota bacterium]